LEYVKLGSTGLEVSKICLGCMSFGDQRDWMLPRNQSINLIREARDLGINFFDTANEYSHGTSESYLGEALRGEDRESVVVATKVYFRMGDQPNKAGLSRKHIRHQLTSSLERLGVDYVDLYQIHRWDINTPIEETLATMTDLVREGRILYPGASSMWAWQFSKSLYIARMHGYERFVSMQNHYNLLYREEEREMMPLCQDQGIAVLPWSPLARGFLSGKYTEQEPPEEQSVRARTDPYLTRRFFKNQDFKIVGRVTEVAEEKGVTPAQIALAWILSKDYVTSPVVGVTKAEHLKEAVEALEVDLADEDIERLEQFYSPREIAGHR
jgi:aryl-alcohol dehydrogenase-like predicted oxidoreductase